jgi:uncharacterized membrane protein YgcG
LPLLEDEPLRADHGLVVAEPLFDELVPELDVVPSLPEVVDTFELAPELLAATAAPTPRNATRLAAPTARRARLAACAERTGRAAGERGTPGSGDGTGAGGGGGGGGGGDAMAPSEGAGGSDGYQTPPT